MSQELEQSIGTGNVFEDLGLPNSGELSAKAKLASQINSILQHRHLSQAEAGKLLGITQPRMSDLMRGKLDKFSIDTLLGFLTALGRDVQITVRKKPKSREQALILVAA